MVRGVTARPLLLWKRGRLGLRLGQVYIVSVKDAADGPRAADAEPEARVEPRNEAGRVLVIEGEFVIALEVEDALRRAGYEVVGPAATPEDAARERRVRGRAYAICEREGRPEGEADRHWFA